MGSSASKCLIIADDLTGANDTGIQFRQHGFDTIVLTALQGFESAFIRFDAVCVDTDTRKLSPAEVVPCLEEILAIVSGCAPQATIYKKVDSTLRGHIGREMDLLAHRLGFDCVFLAPAYPEQGRQTIKGIYLVNSLPITETEFAKDPRFPILTSDLREWIRGESSLTAFHLGLETVSGGKGKILATVERERRRGIQLFSFDCAEASHLEAIAEAGLEMAKPPLFVGSAGLAEKVAAGLSAKRKGGEGCLVIAGSLSQVTSRQVLYAAEQGSYLISLPDGFWEEGERESGLRERVASEAAELLAAGRAVIIWTQSGQAQPMVLDSLKSNRINCFLSELTKEIMERVKVKGLVLTGGETASAILSSLGAQGLRLEAQVLPAIPFGRIVGGSREGLGVVTKAGGFGRPEALAQSIQFMREACRG